MDVLKMNIKVNIRPMTVCKLSLTVGERHHNREGEHFRNNF